MIFLASTDPWDMSGSIAQGAQFFTVGYRDRTAAREDMQFYNSMNRWTHWCIADKRLSPGPLNHILLFRQRNTGSAP